MKLPESRIRTIFARRPVAYLATVGAEGRPHQVPIVFAYLNGLFWSPVDGKPKSGTELTRVHNLRANPWMSLLLEEYDEDWSRLWWIRIDGEGSVTQPANADAISALEEKYPQYQEIPVLTESSTMLCITPTKTVSWCAR